MIQDWAVWIFLALSMTCLLFMFKGLFAPSRVSKAPQFKRKSPVVSVNLKGTLVDSKDLTLRRSEIESFLCLCRLCSLYTVTQVADDHEEAELLTSLEECGAFDRGLQRHRVMFCDSLPGAVAMVRQLQPLLHIEDDSWVAEQLNSKVANVCMASDGLQHCLAAVEALAS
ncbi:hypothetical protein Emag_001468 [Eimeria magna]